MTDGFHAPIEELVAMSSAWSDQADALTHARQNPADAEALGATLGPGVADNVNAFFERWIEEFRIARDSTLGAADLLDSNADAYLAGDEDAAALLQSLMPWPAGEVTP